MDWSPEDLGRIAAHGLTAGEVERQLDIFRKGIAPVRLNRPCRPGDGIVALPPEAHPALLEAYEEARRSLRLVKFTPASGAASRMFRDWYLCLEKGGFADEAGRLAFARDLERFAFFRDLQSRIAAGGGEVAALLGDRREASVLRFILTGEGLDYGCLPKALLKFHAYPEGSRTALEEHLVEASLYARGRDGVSRVHFTLSPEHESAVRSLLEAVIPKYEALLETRFSVGLSTQDPSTDTLAADPQGLPFRTADGDLVFRPGGHGALLSNLNALEADLVFLKNIDNVVPDRLKGETVLWKKLLAGYLADLQREVFARMDRLEAGVGGEELGRIVDFCTARVNVVLPEGFGGWARERQRSFLAGKLDRPLRVCGMVRNEGEPGGGPFWVDDPDGSGGSLQIIEESQIDGRDPAQLSHWRSASYFNPVDLVCAIRDRRGKKYDLDRFVDQRTAAISRKSEKGRELLALERPGLWNGSMAFWNTIFVEVPLATFNPVKTVYDLLRPQHLPA